MTSERFHSRVIDSPLGALLLVGNEAGLVRLAYEIEGHARVLADLGLRFGAPIREDEGELDGAVRELNEYFDGRRQQFGIVPDLRLVRGFRRTALEQVAGIGYGRVASYRDVAIMLGNPNAMRAVGTACASNPIPLIVPCHRVVRSDGTIGNYLMRSPDGLDYKRLLLDLEQAAA